MKKTMTRPLAFLLAALICVLSGCGGNTDPASTPDTSGTSSASTDTSTPGETTPDGSDISSATESTSGGAPTSGPSKENPESDSSNTSTTTKAPDTSSSGGKVDPEKYRGTTVRYATWKDPYQDEDGPVITKFQQKYGITVKIDRIGQTDYIQTLTAMINAGNSPDVIFDNNEFPASLNLLQPVENAQVDLTDEIWDQEFLEQASINGKHYLLNTVGNIWSEVDCIFFNKKIMKANGITTPEEYYAQGNWNFDTMRQCMEEFAELNDTYYGGWINEEILAAMAGTGFIKYQNNKFVSAFDDKNAINTLKDVFTYHAELQKDGLLSDNWDPFVQGKVGVVMTNAYGLKKTGYFAEMNANDIGWTYLPDYNGQKAKTSALFRGWGISSGSQNPVAAGIFIRYYLDVDNYNTATAFLNSEAEKFFFDLTNRSATEKSYYLYQGLSKVAGLTQNDFRKQASVDPRQVSTEIDKMENIVASAVTKANNVLDTVAKKYK